MLSTRKRLEKRHPTIGEERERSLEHGATQVVAKPITMYALQLALQAYY